MHLIFLTFFTTRYIEFIKVRYTQDGATFINRNTLSLVRIRGIRQME